MKFYNNFNEMFNNNSTKQHISVFNATLSDVTDLIKTQLLYDIAGKLSDKREWPDIGREYTALDYYENVPLPIKPDIIKKAVDECIDDNFTSGRRDYSYVSGYLNDGFYKLFYKTVVNNSIAENKQILKELGVDVDSKWEHSKEQEREKNEFLQDSQLLDSEYAKYVKEFNGDLSRANEAFLEDHDYWKSPTEYYIYKETFDSLCKTFNNNDWLKQIMYAEAITFFGR